jgi:carbonic anhydrase/acetyltransferase-like protein (isoleucine patch superfamily)
MITPWKGYTPKISKTAWIEDSAQVIGSVTIGAESSVWFNTVIRGDVNYIKIGERTNIQDGSVLHVTRDLYPLVLGNDITVGHSVTLHGCSIEGPALIGMGSIVMDGAILAPNVIVGAGSLVTEKTEVEEGWLVIGSPAKPKRKLTEKECSWLLEFSDSYVKYRLDYMN